jgi:hypothetical protein
MTEEIKPTKQMSETIWKGTIEDSRGRVLTLRNPGIWDEYLLCKVLGKDAENSQCLMMAEMLIKVAAIDKTVIATPTSYNEFAANLNNLGHEGLNALFEHAQQELSTKEEAKVDIKK